MTNVLEAIQELERRDDHSSTKYVPGDIPGWDQKAFHSSTKEYRLLCGGNQSGKSRANAAEIAWWLLGKHPYRDVPTPPNIIWAISVEYITLAKGIYRHLIDMIPDWEIETIGQKIPQQELPSFIRTKNGSEVWFKSAKGDNRQKFQAAAVDLISVDEEIQHYIWEELRARTMATGGQFILSATLVESYEWIVQLITKAQKGHPRYFITELDSTKNPYLDKDRVDELKGDWSEEERDVRLYGKTRQKTGRIYGTFNKKNIVKRFEIPLDWPRWVAHDPGYRVFASLWIAVSPDDKAYVYREMYERNSPLWDIAYKIRSQEGYDLDRELTTSLGHYVWEPTNRSEIMVQRVIDDKEDSKLITGEEGVMTQLYERYGISCIPADKSLRAGIEDCRWWIEHDFYVFSDLYEFLEERENYRIKPPEVSRHANDPVDKPVKRKDHLMDCWRYIARLRPRYKDRGQLTSAELASVGIPEVLAQVLGKQETLKLGGWESIKKKRKQSKRGINYATLGNDW